MAGLYLDTSALGRILLAEPEAGAIRAAFANYDAWWSSELLVVEMRRLAAREGLLDAAERLLAGVALLPVDGAALQRASRLKPVDVRALDAIHLEAAVALKDRDAIGTVLTYDRQLQRGVATTSCSSRHRPSRNGLPLTAALRRGGPARTLRSQTPSWNVRVLATAEP